MKSIGISPDMDRLRDSLGEFPEPVASPALVVVSGLPGTGKSFFCRQIAERLPFTILETDALRKVIFQAPNYSNEESSHLFNVVHQLIGTLLKEGIPLILDATNLSEQNREYLYGIADRLDVNLILVRVNAPSQVVYQRLKNRASDNVNNSDADWEVYRKMKPTVERINRQHYVVDTSHDINPALDKIVREIERRNYI